MSEIQTFYPTSGMSDRSLNSIMTAFYNCLNNIPEVTDFFDSVEKLGDETTTSYADFGIKFTKGNTFIRLSYDTTNGRLDLNHNASSNNYSGTTQPTASVDIAVRHTTGMNGTNVIWFDNYAYDVCMVFNKFGEKYFLANSAYGGNIAFYYSDTGGTVGNLRNPFNGDNIGKAAEYIAQPYYHLGINTEDIYTFDGGSENIPWGKFKLSGNEFIRISGNFALKIK